MTFAKRPLAVTCLVTLVLTLTGTQILRAWAALSSFTFYAEVLERVPPVFFVLSGLTWGSLGVWLVGGLWRGAGWAPQMARRGLVAFVAFGWLDRLVLQSRGPQTINWAFQLMVTAVLLLSVFGGLALPQAQAYFGDHDERTLKYRRTK